jgi:hypothetical protein
LPFSEQNQATHEKEAVSNAAASEVLVSSVKLLLIEDPESEEYLFVVVAVERALIYAIARKLRRAANCYSQWN